MALNTPSRDLVLLVPTSGPVLIAPTLLQSSCCLFGQRIDCKAILTDPIDSESIGGPELDDSHAESFERIVIIPCGFHPLKLSDVRQAWWFGRLPIANSIFVADPWTPKELGQWLGNRAEPGDNPSTPGIGLSLNQISLHDVQTIVLIAFWANRVKPHAVVLLESPPTHDQRPADFLTQEQIDPEDLATWLLQRYLKAVQSRAIPWNDQSDSDWPILNRLHRNLREQLPSEYSQRLDEVSPRSMGSAKILTDDSGKVPWDKIWTSFCDLAMAGGPPHRGKLLEPVQLEAIERFPEQYRLVVDEIRRGITLASSLETCDSPYLGWVCVQCDSQQMAAWLMRAILVENISVRREDDKLYLPAGPDFRIDKEIKNVITAVAKTNHYWHAHLRSRQPPNPL